LDERNIGRLRKALHWRKEFTLLERDYPGGLTLEERRALPREKRRDLAQRAQCDLLGSFRFCRNRVCQRARSCSGDPNVCREKLWRLARKKPKSLRAEYARIGALADP
jgi:hypothetical protein